MSNTLSVTDRVLKEAQRIAHEKLSFIGTTDLQYDGSFQYNAQKGPNGQSLRVREPNQYTRRAGSRVMDVQDQAESTQTITVATQDGVDMRFNSQELIQSVNSDAAWDNFSKTYIEPAVSVLAAGIEADYIEYCAKATYNVVGTAGTPPTDLVAIGAARAKLNQGLAPKDGQRSVHMDSVTMGGLVNGLKGLFQDSQQIKRQYREGMIGRTGMADWYENEKMYSHTNGADVTGSTDAAALVTDGGNTIDMHTLIATTPIGSVFTVAGVYACNPETKKAYSHLQQFVVTAGEVGVCTVSPSTILTGAKKNVCAANGDELATTDFNAAVVTFVGAASTSYTQNMMYHKEAFQFVTADLPLMDDAHKCVRRTQDNLSMRVWQGSDIRNDELLMRIDILYGMAALRPAWATRITN